MPEAGTTRCPNCGTVVDATAEWCPQCGARVQARPMTLQRFLGLAALALLAFVLGVAGMCALLLGTCTLFVGGFGGPERTAWLILLAVVLYALTWLAARAFMRAVK